MKDSNIENPNDEIDENAGKNKIEVEESKLKS